MVCVDEPPAGGLCATYWSVLILRHQGHQGLDPVVYDQTVLTTSFLDLRSSSKNTQVHTMQMSFWWWFSLFWACSGWQVACNVRWWWQLCKCWWWERAVLPARWGRMCPFPQTPDSTLVPAKGPVIKTKKERPNKNVLKPETHQTWETILIGFLRNPIFQD